MDMQTPFSSRLKELQKVTQIELPKIKAQTPKEISTEWSSGNSYKQEEMEFESKKQMTMDKYNAHQGEAQAFGQDIQRRIQAGEISPAEGERMIDEYVDSLVESEFPGFTAENNELKRLNEQYKRKDVPQEQVTGGVLMGEGQAPTMGQGQAPLMGY